MPLLKDISIQSKKTPSGPQALTVSITATATGSAGYFTGSNGIIYSGATTYVPIYLTLSSSIDGGTPPYTCVWTASTAWYPPGYTAGTNTRSLQLETYAYESDRWIATVTDSSTPPNSKTASYDSIIYANDFEIFVGNWYGNTGSDTQGFDPLTVPGDSSRPLATIGAAIKYAVPDETIMYVASGTYAENPVINKKIRVLDGTADVNGSPRLGTSNYFIYATKELGNGYLGLATTHSVNAIIGFHSSSFSTIAVTTQGSIQSALYDAGVVRGEVYAMAGIHEINTPLSSAMHLSHSFTLRGETVPTGSTDTYIYAPQTILRMTNLGSTTPMFFMLNTQAVEKGARCFIKNLALEMNQGKFFVSPNGNNRDLDGEMVRYRFITNSIAEEMFEYSSTSNRLWDLDPSVVGNVRHRIYNIRYLYISDGQDSGFGSGYMDPGMYSPAASTPVLNITGASRTAHWISAGSADQGIASGSVTGGTNAFLPKFGSTSYMSARSFSPGRPRFGINDDLFNGFPYIRFTGTSINQFVEGQMPLPSNITSASAMHTIIVFRTNENTLSGSTSFPRGVVSKTGDLNFGWSFVISGSNLISSIYNNYGPGSSTQIVSMETPVSASTLYIAEIFFDSSSFDKQVGMGVYDTWGTVTSSYFTRNQFSSSGVIPMLSTGGPEGYTTLGVATGQYRTLGYSQTVTSGRYDAFAGCIAEYYVGTNSGSRSDARQREMYNYLRWKYFPTSSIVYRGISSDSP